MGSLDVTVKDGVQTIRLNRPKKLNAINREMYEGIVSLLEQSAKDDSVVVTVLTGTGDYYSSGNDFSMSSLEAMGDIEKAPVITEKFVSALIDYPKLLVAVVNGPAIGIAVTTLALCDVVFASDKAWFSTPFTQLGIVPEGCSTLTFPRIMGTAKASKLLFLSEKLSANEAMLCGLVTKVYPSSDLAGEVSAQIHKYAKLSAQSLKQSKRLVRGWDRELLHRVNQVESKALGESFRSGDFINAFLLFGKRKSKL